MPRLAIIIVSYNAREDLLRCLAALHEPAPLVAHDIVVVDNQSSDGSAAAVRARWAGVQVIEAGRNAGFAAANNLGIRATHSELVLLLNPDTLVPAGAIDALVSVMDRQPDIAIAGPRLVDAAGRPEPRLGRMRGPFSELAQKIVGRGRLPGTRGIVERLSRRERRVDWVSGSCLLVRRTDAEGAGLLDEGYFMYWEDVDLCATIRGRGRGVLFTPSAEVMHLGGRSAATASGVAASAYRAGQQRFYEKHHPRWTTLMRAYQRLAGKQP